MLHITHTVDDHTPLYNPRNNVGSSISLAANLHSVTKKKINKFPLSLQNFTRLCKFDNIFAEYRITEITHVQRFVTFHHICPFKNNDNTRNSRVYKIFPT